MAAGAKNFGNAASGIRKRRYRRQRRGHDVFGGLPFPPRTGRNMRGRFPPERPRLSFGQIRASSLASSGFSRLNT
jgi:hypothetical protein